MGRRAVYGGGIRRDIEKMMHECENQEDVRLELGGNTTSKRNEQIWFANGSKTWLLIFIEFYNFF